MNERETIYERISELRKDKGLTQKKLCEIAGITASQLNRIENGITGTVSSDVLIKLSKSLNVSADYILGLTPISTRKNYDISELGLSEGAVRAIVSGKADVNVLNALLEQQRFRELLRLINSYFLDSISAGIMARNKLIDLATSSLGDFIAENPDAKSEAHKDIRLLKSSKLGEHEAEIEKIKSIFVAILRDIKNNLDRTINAEPTAHEEMLRRILSEAQKKPKTIEEVSGIVASAAKDAAQLSDKNAESLKQSIEQFIMYYDGRGE